MVFLDDDAGRVVIGEERVDGESDRRVERLRALQVGHRQVDEHRGHRGLPLVGPVCGRLHTCKKQVTRQDRGREGAARQKVPAQQGELDVLGPTFLLGRHFRQVSDRVSGQS